MMKAGMIISLQNSSRSLRWRIFISFILLLLVLQSATLFLLYTGFENTFERDSIQRLDTGRSIFQNEFESRNQFLKTNVTTVSKDWGLRSALGQGDLPTIHSALQNHSQRINADVAIVLDYQGNTLANIGVLKSALDASLFDDLITREQVFSKLITLDGNAYQIVFAPVRAPVAIGWVGLGFSIDRQLAEHFKSLSTLQVSFVNLSGAKPRVMATTLSGGQKAGIEQLSISALTKVDQVVRLEKKNLNVLQYTVPLMQGMNSGVYVLIQQPLDELQQIFWARSLALSSVLAVGTFIAGLIAYLLARTVSSPLQQLITAVGNVGRGRYEKISSNESYREIDLLAKEFNRMQMAIDLREQEIRYRADHDELTGLSNRHSFIKSLELAIDGLDVESGERLKIMIINFSRFQEVVDTLGYDVGDKLIQKTAERLNSSLGDDFLIGRFNSEFVVCNRMGNKHEVAACSQRIHQLFDEPFKLNDVELYLSANIGVSIAPIHDQNPAVLLRLANVALDTAKRKNRSTFIYNQDEDFNSLLRLQIIADMRRAISSDELVLHYQPKVRMGVNGAQPEIAQVECLVRWTHPDHGFMPPDDFIPLAEQTGSIVYLTEWVLKAALRQCKTWQDEGIQLQVAVNISAVDLQSDGIAKYIDTLLGEYHLPPSCLVLEVTESAVLESPERAIGILNQLKERGIYLSIDDYGTGYSSLGQLKKLPVNELKIDKSFVLNMDSDEDDANIVQSTIQLGHSMSLRVTAEGVESSQCLAMLSEYGCDYAQGYFISKPLPIDQMDKWLEETSYGSSASYLTYKNR